ncbi:MAG TPA: sulfite exporter TauE/SafE family protein [Bacteroidales bacterium]|nr:sulfite exporter TauE/SafE family protein [Bacteroidales bacterium]
MTSSTLIILILIGLFAGAFSGMIGLGGGLIIIPALIYLLGMNQYMAQGTSLAIMLPPIGLMAAFNYYKAGALNLKYAMIIAVAFFIGGYFGSKWALTIPEAVLRKIFAVTLIIVAIRMLWPK